MKSNLWYTTTGIIHMSQVSDRLLGSGHIISLITTGSQINIFPLKIIKYIIFKFAKADKEKIMTNLIINVLHFGQVWTISDF